MLRSWLSAATGLVQGRRGLLTLVVGLAAGVGIGVLAVSLLATPPAISSGGTIVLPRLAWAPEKAATGPARHIQPVTLSIPTIEVTSSLVDLGRRADGTLDPPKDYGIAGWFAAGSAPGDAGGPPAIIAGHVDSPTGPAVFYRLGEVSVGTGINVTGLDTVERHFVVYRVATYLKAAFPDAEVYAPSSRAELRLITCTGDFDAGRASYLSNAVVFAYETGP